MSPIEITTDLILKLLMDRLKETFKLFQFTDPVGAITMQNLYIFYLIERMVKVMYWPNATVMLKM